MSELKMARCPLCDEMLEIDPLSEKGDPVICPSCDADLEVVSTNPPKVRESQLEDFDDDYGKFYNEDRINVEDYDY